MFITSSSYDCLLNIRINKKYFSVDSVLFFLLIYCYIAAVIVFLCFHNGAVLQIQSIVWWQDKYHFTKCYSCVTLLRNENIINFSVSFCEPYQNIFINFYPCIKRIRLKDGRVRSVDCLIFEPGISICCCSTRFDYRLITFNIENARNYDPAAVVQVHVARLCVVSQFKLFSDRVIR